MTFQERERRHAPAAAHSQRSLPVYFIASVAAIGGLLFGYDTGVISGALLFLKQSFALNATTQEIAVSAVLVGATIGAIVAGRLNDALGRKKTLLLLAVIFTAGALLTALIIYILAFALSFGPVFWLMSAEIFPTQVRAAGASFSSFANWAANFLVSVTFLSLVAAVSAPVTFWLYACMGVLAFVFSWKLVPETKGRSLEQIERYWENGRHWNKAA